MATGGYAEPGWTMRDVAAARRPFDCRCTQVLQRRERERLRDALVTRITGLLPGSDARWLTDCHLHLRPAILDEATYGSAAWLS